MDDFEAVLRSVPKYGGPPEALWRVGPTPSAPAAALTSADAPAGSSASATTTGKRVELPFTTPTKAPAGLRVEVGGPMRRVDMGRAGETPKQVREVVLTPNETRRQQTFKKQRRRDAQGNPIRSSRKRRNQRLPGTAAGTVGGGATVPPAREGAWA